MNACIIIMGGWQDFDRFAVVYPDIELLFLLGKKLNSPRAALVICSSLIVACCVSSSAIVGLGMTNPMHGLVALVMWCIVAAIYCGVRVWKGYPAPYKP